MSGSCGARVGRKQHEPRVPTAPIQVRIAHAIRITPQLCGRKPLGGKTVISERRISSPHISLGRHLPWRTGWPVR